MGNQKGLAPILVIILVLLIGGAALVFNMMRRENLELSPTPTPQNTTKPSPTLAAKASPSPSPSVKFSPTPSPTPKPASCSPSTNPHDPGTAPYTVFLQGGGSSEVGIIGYQWDFDGNGTWDSDVQVDAKRYTYQEPGNYHPKYRILDKNSNWSKTCDYPFTIVVNPAPTPSP